MRLFRNLQQGTLRLEICFAHLMHDSIDSQHLDRLSVTTTALITLSARKLEEDDLLSLTLFFHCRVHSSLSHLRTTDRCVVFRADHKYVVQTNLLAWLKR